MSIEIIISIVVIVVIISSVLYFIIVRNPLFKLDSIKQMIDNNKLDEALEKLTKIIQQGKANPRTHMYMAEIFEKKGGSQYCDNGISKMFERGWLYFR